MDRLDALRTLVAVVDAGSISGGSRKLNAPVQSVSRKVADLEHHLGTNLLIRTSRSIQLTDAGRDFVASARRILSELLDAERRASGEYEQARGELTLTMPIEFGRLMMLPLAIEFLESQPDISLSIMSVDRYVDLVEEHVDVAVRLGALEDSSLVAVKVGEVHVLTCASPAYIARKGRPLRPEDLVDHDGIIYQPREIWWRYEAEEKSFDGMPRRRVYTNTLAASAVAAAGGAGIAKALDFQVDAALRSGDLVTVLEDFAMPSIPVHLVYHRQGLLPLKVRSFLDWVTPRLRQKLLEVGQMCETS